MSFGKRGNDGDEPHNRSLLTSKPVSHDDDGTIANVRMKVSRPSGMDKGFIALALGVVVLSAGAALAAPSVFSIFGPAKARPIVEIVAGLDRQAARQALARDAFPDGEGRGFMEALARDFPNDHAELVDRMTDTALAGGDRDDIMEDISLWSVAFAVENMPAISRTGRKGFDRALDIASDALKVLETSANGCTIKSLDRFLNDPKAVAALAAYGSQGYKVGMNSTRAMVELAAQGRTAPPISAKLTPDDENAILTAMIGLMMNEQFIGLIQMAVENAPTYTFDGSGSVSTKHSFDAQSQIAAKFDVCKFGRSIFMRLEKLPHGTKERLWAMTGQGLDVMKTFDPSKMQGFPGIPGINAPPPGFPIEMMQPLDPSLLR